MPKNYHDFELKSKVLNSILSNKKDAKSIANEIGYAGTNTEFCSYMNALWRRGFVQRDTESSLIQYTLTKVGYQHAYNPMLVRERKKAWVSATVQKRVDDTLMDDEKFGAAVDRLANIKAHEIASRPVVVRDVHSPLAEDANKNGNDRLYFKEYPENLDKSIIRGLENNQDNGGWKEFVKAAIDAYERIIADLNKTILDLEFGKKDSTPEAERLRKKVEELEKQLCFNRNLSGSVAPTRTIDKRTGKEIEPEELYKINEQRKKREAIATKTADARKLLVRKYTGYFLDIDFFTNWGRLMPYRIKGLGLFKKGSVEVLAPSDKEVYQRDHTKGVLNPQEILSVKFVIRRIEQNGVYIYSPAMKDEQYLKF